MTDTPSATLSLPATIGGNSITIRTAVEVSWEKVVNAIIGAFEGGSNYWLREAKYTHQPEGVEGSPLYAEIEFWAKGGKMLLQYDNPEEPGDMEKLSTEIGSDKIAAGLNAMAAKATRHFTDLVNENDDADTHDVFLQMVLLGEIIYG